jgi:hypothetical protein
MEGAEKAHTETYNEITNDWDCDANYMLTSLPVWDLEHFKRLIYEALSVRP